MEENNISTQVQEEGELFSLRDFFESCLDKWQWFVASVIIFCCIGAFYILRQQPVYERSMAVLIKDQDGGATGADISSAFSSMGLVATNTKVNNELISLTSPAVMYEVIQRLGLDVNYSTPGRFHDKTLYGKNLPLNVKFVDLEEQQDAGFEMKVNSNGCVTLGNFYIMTADGKKKIEKEQTVRPGFEPVSTPLGRVIISPNSMYVPEKGKNAKKIEELKIARVGMQSSVELYLLKVKGDFADKDADVIDLTMQDVSSQRATDVLNTIVEIYNEIWIHDKNKVAVATSNFIDERLRLIQSELGTVDNDISQFKSEHLVPDLEESAKLQMKQSTEMSNKMLEVTNEMTMSIYLRDYLKNPANANNVIPVNTGVGAQGLETSIANYNTLLLSRNTLASSSSDTNPLVIDYDAQLKGLRESIVNAVNAQIVSLNASLRNMHGAKGSAEGMLASGPTQAKYLLNVERQQKVKESLYLYLLQKREENELTQKFTADNTRVITPPTGSLKPVSPKKMMIMAICFLLGLCVPGAALYIAEVTNTRVRGRKDLEKMATPFVGEIPFVGKKSVWRLVHNVVPAKKKKKEHELESVLTAVKEGSRDVISESFRIVRGNIDFMIRDNHASNVIMVTSFNAGSGKSFISFNLAASFALKGKKVLVIDGDLRHGSVSQFVNMPSKGISNYLTGSTDDWRSLVVPVPEHNNMYAMPIGHRPPNPAELLDNGRLGSFLEEARKEYDYIFFDCPPADVVVDTQIVARYVDRTIFVVRAGLLERSAVAEIDAFYKNKRFNQMCMLLNGTYHSGHRYGSGYYGSRYYGYYGSNE